MDERESDVAGNGTDSLVTELIFEDTDPLLVMELILVDEMEFELEVVGIDPDPDGGDDTAELECRIEVGS